MSKATYIPTNTPIIILEEVSDTHVRVFLDAQEKVVSRADIRQEIEQKLSTLDEIKEGILHSMIMDPVSDLLYSYNTDRLVPEHHQYKPLIKMLKSPNNRLLIADEVGLGKTIEAGMIYKEIDRRNDVDIALIVVPSSLTPKWRNEMQLRFNEDFEIYKVNEFKRFLLECQRVFESDVPDTITRKMIISYHTLRDEQVVELLKTTSLNIDVLVMDEAHTFRNKNTSTFDGAEQITALAENILFLTATPVQNSLDDLFNILTLLDKDNFMDIGYFLESIRPNALLHQIIARLKNQHNLEDIKSYINEHDLSNYLLNGFQAELISNLNKSENLTKEERVKFIMQLTNADNLSYIINRTKKKDVGRYIKREASSQTIPPSVEEKAFYNEVVEFVKLLFQFRDPKIPAGFITIMPERMASSSMIASIESFRTMRRTKRFFVKDFDDIDTDLNDIEIQDILLDKLDQLIHLGEQIGEKDSKYQAFEQIVDNLHAQNVPKMIVFSFFKKTLSYLEEKLRAKNLRVGKIDGDMTPEERFDKIQDFKDSKFNILLSSEVGSEGLDMQFCNVVVNYDMPWNPMRVEQRIGRIDRIGQKADKLFIFNLCIEGTIEDRIYSRLYNKLDIFESSIGELEPILGNLTKTFDIQKMLEMSDEEIQFKVDLEGDALIRKKQEIGDQVLSLDGMLNDDYKYDQEVEEYVNSEKDQYVKTSIKDLFLNFLDSINVAYTTLKNDSYKLNKDDARRLYDALKPKMAEKRSKTVYNAQKKAVLKIKNSLPYRFAFDQKKDDFNIDQITLSHPIIKMISKKTYEVHYGKVKNKTVKEATHAIVYRQEIKAHKVNATLEVLLLNNMTRDSSTCDFADFLSNSIEVDSKDPVDSLKEIQLQAELELIKKIDVIVASKREETSRLIDQKILGMKEHFKKRREFVLKVKSNVSQTNIVTLREGQIKNLLQDEINKKEELEAQRAVSGSHQVLSVIEIVH